MKRDRIWFWFHDGNAGTGAVATDGGGIVRNTCPYFWRYRGRRFNEVILDLRERGFKPRWAKFENRDAATGDSQ